MTAPGACCVWGGEYGATVRDRGVLRQTWTGRPVSLDGLRARVSRWPPLRLARMRFERESVGVVLPACCFTPIDHRLEVRAVTRRCFGLDVHREFAQVAIWQDGLVRQAGQIALTAEALRVFADSLAPTDEVALEATGTPTRSSARCGAGSRGSWWATRRRRGRSPKPR